MLAVLPTKDVGTIIIAFNREKPSIKKRWLLQWNKANWRQKMAFNLGLCGSEVPNSSS